MYIKLNQNLYRNKKKHNTNLIVTTRETKKFVCSLRNTYGQTCYNNKKCIFFNRPQDHVKH